MAASAAAWRCGACLPTAGGAAAHAAGASAARLAAMELPHEVRPRPGQAQQRVAAGACRAGAHVHWSSGLAGSTLAALQPALLALPPAPVPVAAEAGAHAAHAAVAFATRACPPLLAAAAPAAHDAPAAAAGLVALSVHAAHAAAASCGPLPVQAGSAACRAACRGVFHKLQQWGWHSQEAFLGQEWTPAPQAGLETHTAPLLT